MKKIQAAWRVCTGRSVALKVDPELAHYLNDLEWLREQDDESERLLLPDENLSKVIISHVREVGGESGEKVIRKCSSMEECYDSLLLTPRRNRLNLRSVLSLLIGRASEVRISSFGMEILTDAAKVTGEKVEEFFNRTVSLEKNFMDEVTQRANNVNAVLEETGKIINGNLN